MFMSIVGGATVMLSLGFSLPIILHQITNRVHIEDLAFGLSKGALHQVLRDAVTDFTAAAREVPLD